MTPESNAHDNGNMKWNITPNRDVGDDPLGCGISWNEGYQTYLVGGIPTALKNMNVSWDDSSQLNGQIRNVPNHQPGINVLCIS